MGAGGGAHSKATRILDAMVRYCSGLCRGSKYSVRLESLPTHSRRLLTISLSLASTVRQWADCTNHDQLLHPSPFQLSSKSLQLQLISLSHVDDRVHTGR